ncbi:Crp/Fnr family transcriptional regulator [Polymorphobacter fuscus]|uniref:Helix-turn-helix domain-containing protein n=1 Tax=Sandarakinorhabdus fusca TaxID=1439888 RepID=A0A7C9GPJ4_9SPHN|nr:Crp/Fnr family transcriptional regulator [Polymorphobacter fuscus]KAB7646368.1 Crp/Fnr family transcriptional regulator [Polymorphobacter fuscus]MQT17597.1 helix-turn-helix domain-containing protein [Polymorphobacter fuscus]NJC09860.1 CRP/FNR family transcriptional regulator [Polymorphobacter fuscus]
MTRRCEDCGVRDRALCGSLDDAELAALAQLGVQRTLARGDTLMRAGDPPLVCANLQRGVMKISTTTAAGDETITGLLYPGDFVGRPFAGAIDQDVVAVTEVELCVFPRAAFERALTNHGRMERLLLQRTLAALDHARLTMVRMAHASATARVAGFVDDIGRRQAPGCRPGAAPAFDLPLSRGEIAELLGLTIETVSRQMKHLETAGMIERVGRRGVVVRNAPALAAVATTA